MLTLLLKFSSISLPLDMDYDELEQECEVGKTGGAIRMKKIIRFRFLLSTAVSTILALPVVVFIMHNPPGD